MSLPVTQPVHATTVARFGRDGWRAVMLTGPSGAGKSDLALRLNGRGWRLVADDWTEVWACAGAVYATAPASLAGRIEARGLGIVAAPDRRLARVRLVVGAETDPVERLPDPATRTVAGLPLPLLRLDLRRVSAVDVVAAALATL